jgi:hypothetical protein
LSTAAMADAGDGTTVRLATGVEALLTKYSNVAE